MASDRDPRVVAHELRLAHGPARSTFHGLTMQPHLVEGDEVETEPVAAAEVRPGDVVTYRSEDKFPTRRVMAVDRNARTFVIMGDSIPGHREYVVGFDDVLARVVRRCRVGAWLGVTSPRWRLQTLRARTRRWLHVSTTAAPARSVWGRWKRWRTV